MIVADQKQLDQIKSFITDYQKVLVVGCGSCVTVCLAGGEAEVKTLSSALRIAFQRDGAEKEILEDCVTRQCEPEFVAPIVERVKGEGFDAVLSLACGVGVNLLAEALEEIPVFPGLNTKFFGAVREEGVWVEMCAGCGDCILHLTGGICPIARCTKSILNGPCGGSEDGKCEISPDCECGWAVILERMKRLGTLEQLDEVMPARDWSTGHYGGPRRVVHEALVAAEDDGE